VLDFKEEFLRWQERIQRLESRGKGAFEDKVFGGGHWYSAMNLEASQANLAPSISLEKPENLEKDEKEESEKIQTFKALEEFAQKAVRESGDRSVQFDGGEVFVQDSALPKIHHEIPSKIDLSLDGPLIEKSNNLNKEPLEVLFIGVEVREVGLDEEVKEDATLLLNKMISAMSIPGNNYGFLPIYRGEEGDLYNQTVLSEALLSGPKVIISLGAVATSYLLKKKQKLSKVHGQFFDIQISNENKVSWIGSVFPIFHPEFLLINPGMKRTTWIDLQKVMEKQGFVE